MAETTNNQAEQSLGHTLQGKYLTFHLSEEVYGVSILKVQEIIGLMPITRVPRSPHYLKGVINLRGRIIPIVDLRLKCNMPEIPYTERTCIIVLEMSLAEKRILVGVVVDQVLEVVSLAPQDIEEAPQYGSHLDTHFILGMARTHDHSVVILLDGDAALLDGQHHLATAVSA